MNKFERLLNIEKEFDLSDLYINDVWIYPVIKQNLFVYELSGNKSTIGHHKRDSFVKKGLSSLVWNSRNKKLEPIDILLVDSANSRRLNENKNLYESGYTDYLYELLDNYKLLTYERPGESGELHYANVNVPLYYPDLKILNVLIRAKLLKKKFNLQSWDKLRELVRYIGTDEKFYDFASEKIARFFALIHHYNNLLKITCPRLLLLINAYNYSNMAFVYAAKLNKIKTVELQHGFIRSDHPGYIYKQVVSDKLFPEYIFTYGEYFTDLLTSETELLKNGRAISVGSVGIERSASTSSRGNTVDNKIILVTSQWSIREKLKKIILESADKLPEGFKIIYKTHPLEKETKKFYKEFFSKKNIELIDDPKVNSTSLMQKAFLHVTGYSTSFMEAHYLAKPTLFVHVEGYSQVIEKFIDNKTIFMAYGSDDFITKTNDIRSRYKRILIDLEEQKGRFYKPDPEKNIVSEINKIMDVN